MRRKIHSLSAALLALLMLLSLSLPAAASQEASVVSIRTAEDWEQLARSCTLDAWSRGKTVVLESDLDLSGGTVIPTFGGVFDGGGHTISGLAVAGEGSHQGLFRYVQEGAVIRHLTLTGRVDPGGEWEALGGIAGVNRGTITGCTFQGVVRGGGMAGGIAGLNEAEGQIVLCTAAGIVSGGYSTGGIVGENYGSLSQCTNRALVNTQEADASPELDGIDWGELNSTRNFPACTDTGGIAGYSKGSIQDCVNQGRVGYPHTGYNVGGIAGRQAGYLAGCVNEELVQGRKDVGGIVGQMEPYTLLRYEESTLRELADRLDALSDILDGTLDHTDSSRRQIADRITAITDLTDGARSDTFDLLDLVTDLLDGTVDTANDLSGRVAEVLEEASPVAGDLSRAVELLAGAMDIMDGAVSTAGGAETELSDAIRAAQAAAASLTQAKDAFDRVLEQLRQALEGGQAPAEALRAALESLGTVTDQLQEAVDRLSEALPHLEEAGKITGGALEDLRPAMEDLESGSRRLSRALEKLESLLETQAEKPALEFPKLDGSFYYLEDRLSGTLSDLTEAMEGLNQNVNTGGDTLSGDLRQVNRQFSSITALLRDASGEDQTDRDLVVDVSQEEVSSATLGKVTRCTNRAAVEGDLNVGGVIGAMAVEFDFDPEDDTARLGERSMDFQYLTSAVLLECVNRGTVTARKDCAGGVVGWMDLGIAVSCQGLGNVESTGGNYVGGVAGLADSIIRGSWAKCALSGGSYVGGIAGSAADLTDCGAMVQIREGSACVGAVAGESTGTLTGNRFVSETLGGVDGISYAGKAEPVSYEALLALPDVPEAFSEFTLTFTAGDETVAEVPFRYGQSLETLPAVPEREGFYGAWERFDQTRLTFDDTIEAVYTPWVTTLGDAEGQLLAEGRFTPETALRVQHAGVPLPESSGGTWGPWSVETSDGASFTALRLACPEDARHLAVRRWTEEGTWETLASVKAGSYLRVELETSAAVLCLTETDTAWRLPAVLLAGLAACALCLYGLRKRRRAKGKTTAGR